VTAMKVTTSCYGRFWVFDQARQLHKHGVLHQLINDYPKFMTRRWGIPDEKVTSLLANGIYGKMIIKSRNWFNPSIQSFLTKSVHYQFSSRVPSYLSENTDIFIGLSSFSLETIQKANKNGMKTIVDHGSLHQRVERELLIEENKRWGLPLNRRLPPEWIIEKEDHEFHIADRVMVLSQVAKKTMLQSGIPEEKIFVNQLGVNLTEFFPGKKQDRVFRIIQCGGIHQRKGVQYLLKAFTELNLKNAELWFIGGGLETSSLRPMIRQYTADNIFFKGSYPQRELRRLYAQGSVFVLASIADGFGMVVPQAMACELPVIVTENVGAADIVTSGKTGFVIPIRDVETLKQKILFMYENQEICREMGIAACQSITNGQTWDEYGVRLVDFLHSILPAKRQTQ
jgi:glycosyltransferase involved in cell wall biosynthesis